MQTLTWLVTLAAVAVLGFVLGALRRRDGASKKAPPELPTEWALSARPVFSAGERRVHRLLREALPRHVILSKLPLVRFCQPLDPGHVRYWYELLDGCHVTFAVCSANGRVLAAIDLETRRGQSRRTIQIKQAVLRACHVPHLEFRADQPPSIAELQALVPAGAAPASDSASTADAPVAPALDLNQARDSLASTVASRRAERTALWQDSTVFQDSFFTPDSRLDHLTGSDFGALSAARRGTSSPGPAWRDPDPRSEFDKLPGLDDDIGGRVVDPPSQARG